MIFSELYSAYYNVTAAVIKAAIEHPLHDKDLLKIIEQHAFKESIANLPDSIRRWNLLNDDGTTDIINVPTMPLTTLEKRWLKSVLMDPRIRLFGEYEYDLEDVEPLFLPSDYSVFDRYDDGDPYEDEEYIGNFRLILNAIRNRIPLKIRAYNRRGNVVRHILIPEQLEYSMKDDKFRIIGEGTTINLSRIIICTPYEDPYEIRQKIMKKKKEVVFELVDRRKALERVLLHFAHFEKQAERIDDDRYLVTVRYDGEDETELLIRILSFGPMIRVKEPAYFVDLIKERLKKQMKL